MIVVFGSMNADYLLPLAHFPAPGETVLTPDYVVKPGGKGNNQAVAAALAGGKVSMVGMVGNDPSSKVVTDKHDTVGIDRTHVGRSEKPTAIATIMVDESGENSIVVASGANRDAKAEQVTDEMLANKPTVVMQMEIDPQQNWRLVDRAHDAGARIIVNVAPAGPVPKDTLEKIDVLVVNELEARTVVESLGEEFKGHSDAAAMLAKNYGLTCIVTLGAEGVIVAEPQRIFTVGALSISPVDTTGAGDAFVGVLSAGLDAGLDMTDAVRQAVAGSGLACLKIGAQESLPKLAELKAKLADVPQARPLGGCVEST